MGRPARRPIFFIMVCVREFVLAILCCVACLSVRADDPWGNTAQEIDSIAMAEEWFAIDQAILNEWLDLGLVGPRKTRLEENDFKAAADSLQVDVATIHAVVEIEAGHDHSGFWAEGKPVINFSLDLFRRFAKRDGINVNKYKKTHPEVFRPANRAKYGSQQAAVQARLDGARAIDDSAAIEATYWGMFQIGGFNWKKCGTSSPQDFAERMSRSEHDQMELFINFLRSTGLDKPLQSRKWAQFARGYNGTSYARRGYHKRLARAYKKYLDEAR